MNRTIVLVAFCAACAAIPAMAAQATAGGPVPTPLVDLPPPRAHGDSFKSLDHLRHERGVYASRIDAPFAGVRDAAFTVRFDDAVSRDARRDYIAEVERISGRDAARALDAWYDQHDARALLGEAMAPYDLRGDDFGDITTAWLVVMWSIANQVPLPAADAVQAVRAQTRASLLDNGGIPARADTRQRALEALVYQTVTLMQARASAEAGGDAAYLDALADSAQASMRLQRVDLRATALSDSGMTRR